MKSGHAITLLAMLGVLTAGGVQAAQTVPAPLSDESLPYAQDTPLPLAKTSERERAHNKQVVLDFYHKVADQRAWNDDSLLRFFDPNFIQHDPAEPSTVHAYAQYMASMSRSGAAFAPDTGSSGGSSGAASLPPPRRMIGTTPTDANHSPVEWLMADGDLVVAARRRNWDWPDGPEAVFNGIFVDIWRLKNGKITEQWCSCTPADARLKHMAEAKADGYWKK